ncbi:MAG TPA: hypothetical protein VIU82_21820 [Bosea sp. (in: a-proteobacteria)]
MDVSKLGVDELLKPFPLLQMFIGGAVFLAIMAVTLRGLKENKKEAHLAPPGHDSLGASATVFANSALVQLSMIVDGIKNLAALITELRVEQVKTNSRLAEIKESHGREMDHLRETIERQDER